MAYVYRIGSKNKKNFFGNFSVNTWLILVNFVSWFVILIALSLNSDSLKYFALQPNAFIQGEYLWTIFTSMFSHIYFWHIMVNMITLSFIGGFVQKILGQKRYLFFYLASGIFASLFFILLSVLFKDYSWGERFFGSPGIFALGASGAIFGLAGLITVLIPRMKVLVYFILPMQMWMAMVFFLGFFWILSAFAGLPIGNSAHLGGFLAGIIYGFYLKNKFPKKTRALSRYFS